MARELYDGYGITELRRWATELNIPGRSKMTGDELVIACKAANLAKIKAHEAIVAPAATEGALLRFITHPGCVIRVTSHQPTVDPVHGTRWVTAVYVSMCENCGGEASIRNANRQAHTYRFFLHSLEAVPGDGGEPTAEPVDPRNDPAERKPNCPGGMWCRCKVSTPCTGPALAGLAPVDADTVDALLADSTPLEATCTAEMFGSPHAFDGTPVPDGIREEWELCGCLAADRIHRVDDGV